jgi:hypothetical protein
LNVEERVSIDVPGAWELTQQDYEGVAYYRRVFKVPADWSGRVVRLRFGAVNYRSEVWLNEEVVGFHEGGFTPFEFRVDEILKPGEANVLMVRVLGPIVLSSKVIDGVGPLETPQWRGGITGGIWQPVSLVATGDIYIQDVFIEPRLSDNTASFQVELNNASSTGNDVEVEISIHDSKAPAKVVSQVREDWDLRPGVNKRTWTISVPNAKLWSPDNPSLYRGKLRIVSDGEESDRWNHRFGMRELTIKNRDFYLNGKPIYIKATFFEGLYPVGIAYPDSEEMARREIQLAKDAGFNMIRPWRRPPAPMWLDLADEMGVLTVGSPALECMQLPLSTPFLPSRVENEIRQAVLRDRNRACVVQWELFNELHRPILKQMMRPMALLAREMDPTRLILDESGGWAYGANMYLPYETEPTKFNDIHNYPGPFINQAIFDGFLAIGMTDEEKRSRSLKGKTPGRNVVPGLMSFVSELGYGSLPDLIDNNDHFRRDGNPLTPAYRYHHRLAEGQKRMLQESGFDKLYPDFRQFFLDQQAIHGAANKRMVEAVRSNPEVDGYCIHALTAGDWILGAGLLDLWRNPKSFAYEGTKAANQPRILPIRVSPRNIYAEKGGLLEITGVNELEALNAVLSVQVVREDGKVVFSEEVDADWVSGVSRLFKKRLETGAWRGTHTVKARMASKNGSVLAENAYGFDVFAEEDLTLPPSEVAVLDLTGSLTPFLKQSGIEYREFDASTSRSTPVFVTSVKPGRPADEKRFRDLLEFVKGGGTAAYIRGAGTGFQQGGSDRVASPAFPFSADLHPAVGLWTCIPHLVHDHPMFAGLPSNGAMRDVYENVWARQTLRNLEGEPIVGSVGFVWFSRGHKLHYSGPGDSWWGSDVAMIRLGKGRCLVSQLRIVENLGKDPVADKLLFNIIRFLGGASE